MTYAPSTSIASRFAVAAPSMFTVPLPVNVIGAAAVPCAPTVKPVYVPALTMTVSPGCTRSAACWIVSHGVAVLPSAESLPLEAT